eukprot:g6777.t1
MASDNVKLGFVEFAEKWNGRMAMLGFTIGLATKVVTGSGTLQQLGLDALSAARRFKLFVSHASPVNSLTLASYQLKLQLYFKLIDYSI